MSRDQRRFERYTAAFIDYQIATSDFNEAMFNTSKNEENTSESIAIFARILIIKHTHFLNCAQCILNERVQVSTT